MTKTDDLLKQLRDSIPEYIRKIGEFQLKNKPCHVVNHYFSDQYLRCFCGHFPIVEIFVVGARDGERFNVGNCCIDKIPNIKIAKWFKDLRKTENHFEVNRQLIDFSDAFLKHSARAR